VYACRMSKYDGSFLVMSRGILFRGTPKRLLIIFQSVIVTSEWLIKLRAFSLATRYMFSF
jgi:hypothetical protein